MRSQSTPESRPAQNRLPRSFYTILLATVMFAMGMTIMIPIGPLYITDELNQAERWVGTSTLAVALAAVFTRIPSGVLSDRYGRRRLLVIGAVLGVVSGAMLIFSQTLLLFLLSRLLIGLGLGIFTTAGKALSTDLAPAPRRGEAMGIYNAAFSFATIFSPLLGEGIKNALGFHAVFVLNGILLVIAFVVTLMLPADPPTAPTGQHIGRDLKATLAERGTWATSMIMLGMASILTLMYTFYPLLAERNDLYEDAPKLLSSIALGMGLSIWALTDTIIEPLAGQLSDRIGRQPIIIPGLILAAIGIYTLSRANNTASAYLAIVAISAGWGITRGMADALSQDVVSPALRGSAAAIAYTSFDGGVGTYAQVFSGLIDGNDFSQLFVVTAIVAMGLGLLGFVITLRVRPYEQRAAAQITPVPGFD
ncbi:MAG: MFS transporter [Anaerolineae bacterium]|nr:MFS transporter [Anaerolineae bacterium]